MPTLHAHDYPVELRAAWLQANDITRQIPDTEPIRIIGNLGITRAWPTRDRRVLGRHWLTPYLFRVHAPIRPHIITEQNRERQYVFFNRPRRRLTYPTE